MPQAHAKFPMKYCDKRPVNMQIRYDNKCFRGVYILK